MEPLQCFVVVVVAFLIGCIVGKIHERFDNRSDPKVGEELEKFWKK